MRLTSTAGDCATKIRYWWGHAGRYRPHSVRSARQRHAVTPVAAWASTDENLQRAREHIKTLRSRMAAGTFRLAEEFPEYVRRHAKEMPLPHLFCDDVFDAFLAHERARVSRGDLAPSTFTSHRQILEHTWRPALGDRPLLSVRYSQLQRIADGQTWTKKTYNNAISALRRAFDFGFKDHPELVASPRLFAPECKTPRQMRLANALCRYIEMATSLPTVPPK